jgi:hypothetical protein
MIVTDKTPCFGVMCHGHAKCMRYAMVESKKPDEPYMATCRTFDGQRPHFIQIEPAGEKAE